MAILPLPPHAVYWIDKTQTEIREGIVHHVLTSGDQVFEFCSTPGTLVSGIICAQKAYTGFIGGSRKAVTMRKKDA